MEATTQETLGNVRIDLEFEINAARERVWEAYTKETGEWWHKDFAMLEPKGKVILEPWAGGRLYEENENGDSLFWYHVTLVKKNSTMTSVGHLSPPWGGPATLHMTVNFEDLDGGRTKMTIREDMFGVVSEKLKEDIHSGWKMFYNESFIPYVEGK